MMNWKLSPCGLSASRTLDNGHIESRMVEAIPDDELASAQPADPLTLDEITSLLSSAVQSRLDDVAKSKGYDSILSACSYAGAPNAFQAESVAFITWRGAVWEACYAMLAAFQAGQAAVPTKDELIAALPPFAG